MMAIKDHNPENARRATVVGLGETGYACARHLRRQGWRVAVTDTRAEPPYAARLRDEHPEIIQAVGDLDAALLRGGDTVVLSPGVDPRVPAIAAARAAGVEVIGEIELFARAAEAPVIAVTGSNGKSTVTTLVAAMIQEAGLNAAAGGNLGPAALALLERPVPNYYVLELSSFQLETVTSLAPAASVVLNVSADHMDRYDGLGDYAATKARIYERAATAVINRDDRVVAAMAHGPHSVGFTTGRPQGCDWGIADGRFTRGHSPCAPVEALALPGTHNRANALAALALGDAIGLAWAAMARALSRYRGLPHRMAHIAHVAGRDYYDDSKGTNVGATVSAVSGIAQPLVLIAGGQGKDQDFAPLAAALRGRVRAAVLIGTDAAAIAAVLADVCPVETAVDMDGAVHRAAALSRPGDAVVLSPACASQDMFTDYAERGRAFQACVEGLSHD
ncbi:MULTISPECIES: UDP-N-acetylmuramoyl-L-alanine--D-glutamate ligase [Arhodomonas]|uniref:UDP-N-acetylmuramoyl-L-alanine--D-glutamate ligase n=1 Tax=Arhodomonas TaxID=2368 RepID=UPI000372656D|nr:MULTISPECIES: UDP-N-acetylmuramoyl-L-alanine--D-glutamate ligase [Arhodomonas]